MDQKDPPLDPVTDSSRYLAEVIDLSGVRVRLGRTSYKIKKCEHKKLIYCQSERRIWCEDCDRTIDSFDGFMTLTNHFAGMLSQAKSLTAKAVEAMKSTARLRATKELDRIWGRSMAPCCPNCKHGLLPEDFADGAAGTYSAEFVRASRAKNG